MLLAGGAATLGIDQMWLREWAASGIAFPIGQRLNIPHLPQGRSTVYYESPGLVPKGDVALRLWDADGERVRVKQLSGETSFRMLLGGWSGRAFWELDLPTSGSYDVLCTNYNFLDDRDIPAHDRVVFLKDPDTLDQATAVRKAVQIAGATATFVVAVFFYLLHFRALRSRRLAASAPSSSDAGLGASSNPPAV